MANDSELEIQLDGKTYAIEDFELGELEWLEDELGGPLDEVSLSSMKAAVRFVTVIKRRDNADFSLDDARKLTLRIFDNADDAAKSNGGATAKRPTKRAKSKGSGANASS